MKVIRFRDTFSQFVNVLKLISLEIVKVKVTLNISSVFIQERPQANDHACNSYQNASIEKCRTVDNIVSLKTMSNRHSCQINFAT